MTEKKTPFRSRKSGKLHDKVGLPFTKVNFMMMGGCLLLIIVGFILMSGGGSDSDVKFNPEIFSTRRIVVGPLLTFLGFLFMALAIMWTPRKKAAASDETAPTEDTVMQTSATEETKIEKKDGLA